MQEICAFALMEVSIEVDVNCLDKLIHIASGFLGAIPGARAFQVCGIYAKASSGTPVNISGYWSIVG